MVTAAPAPVGSTRPQGLAFKIRNVVGPASLVRKRFATYKAASDFGVFDRKYISGLVH